LAIAHSISIPNIVQSVSFSPDGQILATASYDYTVKLWRSDGSLIATLQGHTQPVMSVSFSPDGQMIASGSQDGTVRLWDRNGKLIWLSKLIIARFLVSALALMVKQLPLAVRIKQRSCGDLTVGFSKL
jgi:WD40 repeat protein